MADPDWQRFEQLIAEIRRDLAPTATVSHNVKLPGRDSETDRQIDVLLEQSIGQYTMRIVIDCKDYGKPVDVKGVEEFIGMVRDVGAHQGSMVCPKGFTTSAKKRAKRDNIALFSLVDTEKHKWQTRGVMLPTVCDFRTAAIGFRIRCTAPVPFMLHENFLSTLEAFDEAGQPLGVPLKTQAWIGGTSAPILLMSARTMTCRVVRHVLFGDLVLEVRPRDEGSTDLVDVEGKELVGLDSAFDHALDLVAVQADERVGEALGEGWGLPACGGHRLWRAIKVTTSSPAQRVSPLAGFQRLTLSPRGRLQCPEGLGRVNAECLLGPERQAKPVAQTPGALRLPTPEQPRPCCRKGAGPASPCSPTAEFSSPRKLLKPFATSDAADKAVCVLRWSAAQTLVSPGRKPACDPVVNITYLTITSGRRSRIERGDVACEAHGRVAPWFAVSDRGSP